MKNQDGSVLILSLVFMLALIILLGGMSITINNELKIVNNEYNMVQAQYYAESCLEYSSYFLGDDSKWDDDNLIDEKLDYLKDTLDGILIDYISRTVLGEDNYNLKTKINYQGISKGLSASYFFREYIDDVYNKAIATKGDIHFNGDEKGEVNGDIYTNKKVVDINNTPPDETEMDFNGDVDEEQKEDIIPDYSYYFNNNFDILSFDQNNDNYFDFYTFSNRIKQVNNNTIFGGKLTINGKGILVVNGEMTVRDQAKINVNSEDFFIIICNGNVIFEDTVEGNFLLYSTGQIQFHDKVDINGTLIAEDAEHINDHFYLDHDNSYLETFKELGAPIPTMDPSRIGTYEINIIDWMEF